MEMPTIIKSVASLFLIMLAGVYGGKKGIIDNKVSKGLTDILLDIALPCMILTSFNFPYEEGIKSNMLKTFYYSLAAFIIIAIASYLLTMSVKTDKRTILHFANVFTNTGYIGFPILNAIYGPQAVMYGSIFQVFYVIFLWTYGVLIFKSSVEKNALRKELLKAVRNPSLIAVYLGVAMVIFNLQLPEIISVSTSSIGSISGPLSMIIIGVVSYKIKIKDHLKDWTLYYGVALKLIIIPGILFLISLLIKDRSIVSNSIIILSAMPAAAMTSIFADSYDIERDYGAVVVVVTTLLSILTIPVLLKIII